MNRKALDKEYRYLSKFSFGDVSVWKLRPEIPLPVNSLQWGWLSSNSNPGAVELMLENPNNINFDLLSFNKNPKALNYLLNDHPGQIHWDNLAKNESSHAVNAVINHGGIYMNYFLQNSSPRAVEYLLAGNLINENTPMFSMNKSPRAVDFLLNNQRYISYPYLCANSNDQVVDIILSLPLDQISWPHLSANTNRRIVEFLTQRHPGNIEYWVFSKNNSSLAMNWLLAHPMQMHQSTVYANEQIFVKNRWKTAIKPAVKMLSAHHRAIISANHPIRKHQRGEFEQDYPERPYKR